MVTFLDQREAIRKEGEDCEEDNQDEKSVREDDDDDDSPFLIKKKRYPCMYLIIQPAVSAWHGAWKGLIYISLFYGYIRYPMHIAYALSELHSTKDNRIHIEPSLMHRAMGIELILDILMCIDILMNFLTSYQSRRCLGLVYAKGYLELR